MHLGIIGYGNISTALTELLQADPVIQITVLVRQSSLQRTKEALRSCSAAKIFEVVTALGDLISAKPDLVVECADQEAVAKLVPQVLDAGIKTVLASIGALADNDLERKLVLSANAGRAKLILPAGAIGGIDLLAALAPAGDLSVSYCGTKPPGAWKGTPAEAILDLDALDERTVFFIGNAREAARAYPKNANVASTLALAGAGFEATKVQLVADPGAEGNLHAYEVHSQICQYSMEIRNMSSHGNMKTSVATVYSLLREINRIRHPIVL